MQVLLPCGVCVVRRQERPRYIHPNDGPTNHLREAGIREAS